MKTLKMKILKPTLSLMVVLFAVISIQSCSDECDDGYMGTNCENFDPTQVQTLLDNGITPLELFNEGIAIEQLYGKIYQEGLIFYLNTTDGTGMVAAIADQTNAATWGCFGYDIPILNNVENDMETEEGARIGDGKANTDAILDMKNGCNTNNIAAKLCRDIGSEWFLPSRGELNLMFTNLHLNEHGNFALISY